MSSEKEEVEVHVLEELNGMKCENCDRWIPLELALKLTSDANVPFGGLEESIDCCDNPHFKRFGLDLVAVEELSGEINVCCDDLTDEEGSEE